MADVAITVVGAGVVGLAITAELAATHTPIVLLERNRRHGEETSSRNSEVIHAGIYYTPGSLKARLCVEGNRLLYALCSEHGIPHKRITKVITATTQSELGELEAIVRRGSENGAELRLISAAEVHSMEPNVVSVGGVFSPSTGIISAHGLMDYFLHAATARGATVQFRCSVVSIERRTDDFLIAIDEGGTRSEFTSERVINAAGLDADTVAAAAGIDVDAAGYRLVYCKGSYFAVPGSMHGLVHRLVYPVPTKDSLGVHAVVDLGGRLRFGPDVEYLEDRVQSYSVDESKREAFAESVGRILPQIRSGDLWPDLSGIRPKLQRKGEPPRDFVIREETDRGLRGLINLIGIESPGLTASPAIARYVRTLLEA